MSVGTVHYWIANEFLPARRGPADRWCIPFPPEIEAACRRRAADSAHQHTDIDPRPRHHDEHTIAEVTAHLGVKPDVVYHRTQRRFLPSRRGPGARVFIRLTSDVEAACLHRIVKSYKLSADVKAQAQQRLERIAV